MQTKRTLSCLLFCGVILFSACACSGAEERFWHQGSIAQNKKFIDLTDDFFHKSYKNDMLNLHFTVKDLQAYGFDRPAMNLFAENGISYRETLKALKEINYDKLSRKNQITYDIMYEDLSDALNDTSTYVQSYFSYFSGPQSNLPTILTEYEFFVEQDINDYLDLLEQIPQYFNLLYKEEETHVNSGYGLSDENLELVQQQFVDVYSEGENSCLISSFNEKIEAFDGLSASEKDEYKTKNRSLIENEVFVAYRETCEKLSAFKGKGKNDGGLCGFSGGKKYYKSLLKTKTGFSGTPDELFERLMSFIQEQYLQQYAVAAYYPNEYLQWYNGEARGMTDPTEILDYFSENLTREFPAIANTAYTVKYLSESIAATMPNTLAYYVTPQLDNYQNGVITVNPYVADNNGIMNTLAHEGYPGHLYQNVYFLSTDPDPVRTCFSFSGYTEGWAVYASNRAEYLYDYTENNGVYTLLNESNVNLSYAIYAMADIGVNYYGWTAEDLVSACAYWTPSSETAEAIRDTVILMPGAYLSYGAGNMLMCNLRSYAESREGEAFDAVDFHRFILDVGPCNFSLLEKLEEEYYDIKLGENVDE